MFHKFAFLNAPLQIADIQCGRGIRMLCKIIVCSSVTFIALPARTMFTKTKSADSVMLVYVFVVSLSNSDQALMAVA